MKRRILPMIMAVIMILSIIQVPAWAADESSPMETADSTELADVGGDDSNEGEPETQDGNDVAQIGDTGYSTLQAAIDAIENEGIITLLTDVSGTQISEYKQMRFYDANKTITIDLKGKTITASATEAINIYAPGLTLTIKNGTIINRTEGDYSDGIYAFYDSSDEQHQSNNLNLTLENIKLDSRTQAIAVQGNTTNSNVTLDNCVVTSDTLGIYYPPKSGTLSISDTSITAHTGVVIKGSSVEISGNTHISATGEKVDPDDYYHGDPNSSLTLTGDAIYVESGYNDRDISLKITGGTFESENGDAVRMYIKAEEVTSVERDISISGGTFSSNVSEYLDPSSNITTDINGDWVVAPLTGENATASVGDKYYNSLSAAIAAAGDGDTVTLLKDNETTDTIVVSENLTLDLHGCTLTLSQPQSKEPQFVVSSTGDLTIRDTLGNGKMDITGSLGVKSGKLTLESGTIESDYYGIYVYDNGTAVINGGTINSKYAGLSGNNTTGDMNFEVNGGKLNTTDGPAIYMPGQMTLKITGGTLNGGISLRMGQVTISGGTINATAGSIDDPKDYYNKSENAWLPDALYVFNGTYGSGNETYGNALNLTITGGTFNCANGQGSAIAIYDIGKVSQESAVTISGNAELSTNAENREAYQVLSLKDIGIENPDTGYGNTEFVGKADTSISGGTFSSVVKEEYCADGFEPVTTPGSDGKYTVEVANDMTAKIVDANGNDVAAYETLDAALTHVASGQTIVLLQDLTGPLTVPNVADITYTAVDGVTVSGGMNGTVAGNLTLDGITFTGEDVYLNGRDGATITVKDCTFSNVTAAGNKLGAFNMVTAGNLVFTGNRITGTQNAEGSTEAVGIYTQNLTDVTISGNIIGAVSGTSINVNGNKGTTTITGNELTDWASAGGNTPGRAIRLSDSGSSNITITGNKLVNSRETLESYIKISGVEENTVDATRNYWNGKSPDSRAGDGNPLFEVADTTVNEDKITSEPYFEETTMRDPEDLSDYVPPVTPDDDDDSSSSSGSTSVRRYNIEADAGRGGDISPDGRVRVRRGEDQTFRITADDGWEIYDVEVDGESVGAVSRYTFENVREDHTISATFRQTGAQTEEAQLPFLDVAEGAWYYDAVAYCYENGIMDGTSSVSFAPGMLLNRAMAAQVLYNLADGTASTAAGFPDVAASAWYADAVNWAAANGYVTGYDNGSFGPEDSLTREQLAVILYRYAGSPEPTGSLDGFTDAASTSDYAVDALRWAVGEGLLTGKDGGRLDPAGTASRAELAQILARFAQM